MFETVFWPFPGECELNYIDPLAHPDSDLIVGRSSVPEPIRCPLLKKPPIPRTTTMAAKSAAYSTSTARMPHLRAYSCAAYSD